VTGRIRWSDKFSPQPLWPPLEEEGVGKQHQVDELRDGRFHGRKAHPYNEAQVAHHPRKIATTEQITNATCVETW